MQIKTRRAGNVPRSLGMSALLCLALLALPVSASAYALHIVPGSQTVGLGTEVTVRVEVSDAMPGGLGSYDFRFNFDSTVLSFDRFTDGAGLGLAFGLGLSELGSALLVSDFSLETEADLLSLQAANFTLFTLVFDTVGVGTSGLDMTDITLSDAGGTIVAGTANTGSVTVQASSDLPEPATWALVGAALAAGLGTSRRQAQARA